MIWVLIIYGIIFILAFMLSQYMKCVDNYYDEQLEKYYTEKRGLTKKQAERMVEKIKNGRSDIRKVRM